MSKKSESVTSAPVPPAKFSIGDPVHHGDNEIHFISAAMWVPELNTWRYGLNYSQTNMCSLSQWHGGGSCFWCSENEFTAPQGEKKLLGELWREIRLENELKTRLKQCTERADKLRFALIMIRPDLAPKEET